MASTEYHKIQSVFKRDPANNHRTFLAGEYSLPEFEYLKDNLWEFTEKFDGTNIRVHIDPVVGISFGGKTDAADMPKHILEPLVAKFGGPVTENLLMADFNDGATLYGEMVGAKIQKGGGNYGAIPKFVLFDVKVGDWWLKREDVLLVAHKYHIESVPVIGYGTLLDMEMMVRNGIKASWGDFPAEGIVARPLVELFTRSGERIITKLKAKDF